MKHIIGPLGQVDKEKLAAEVKRLEDNINPEHFSGGCINFKVEAWTKIVGEESIYIDFLNRREETCGKVRIKLRTGEVEGTQTLSYNTRVALAKVLDEEE